MAITPINDILEKKCDFNNPNKTGLLLLDLPTGFGKTYQVLRYIYDIHNLSNKKIIFLTNLKKNLPYDTLRVFFEEDKREKEYEEKVIFMNSNVDHIIEFLPKEQHRIPKEFTDNKEFKRLVEYVDYYNKIFNKKYKQQVELELLKNVYDQIRLKYEPIFRKLVIHKLREKKKKKEEREELIKKHPSYKWITLLYPAALSSEKQIFFMSVDKFLAQNTPLVESSYYFTDNTFLNNALIFIDEFDASKEVFLRNIIRNQLDKRVDIISLFENIYSGFQALTLPKIFYNNSATKLLESKKFDVGVVIQKIEDAARALNDTYNLTYSLKTIGADNKQNFLFHDYRYHTIVNSKKRFIYLKQDKAAKINKIHFVEKSNEDNKSHSITQLLNALRGFINYFKGGARIIAENYQHFQNENKSEADDKFTFENALRTFFTELRINNEQQNYLLNSIQTRKFDYKQRKKEKLGDNSFYFNGFRFYDFEDNERHHTKSKVFAIDFENSPERIMLDLSSNNFVVGISATAKIDSVLGNYDLKYLRRKLKSNYIELSDLEEGVLKKLFEERLENYVSINADFLAINNPERELAAFQFSQSVYNQLWSELEPYELFQQCRYLRIAKAFEVFIKNDTIQSFLCFLNTHPTTTNDNCNISVLELLFRQIITHYEKEPLFKTGNNFDVAKSYFILNSRDFDNKLETLMERLHEGKKLFLITTYQTLGAGQNIQYGLSNFKERLEKGMLKQVYTPSFKLDLKKDFDGIYLDKPTNLLVNTMGELSDTDVNKRIFQAAMLHQDRKIFYPQLVYEIKRTFQKAYYQKSANLEMPKNQKNFYQTETYRNFVAKEVIQAIGRISRTFFKSQEIYVLADIGIAPCIKFFDIDNHFCLKEFEALVDAAEHEDGEVIDNSDENLIEIEYNIIQVKNWIDRKLLNNSRSTWSKIEVEEWEMLREITLKYPTISKEELEQNDDLLDWQFIYIPMLDQDNQPTKKNGYYYRQESDYAKVEINFKTNEGDCVSADNVFLKKLMSVESLKEFFEQNHYAIDFKTNDYVISPQIYHNIYKGALGEVIGKFIFEHYILPEQELQDLPFDIFERFDYMLDDGVFIDFKFWKDETQQTRQSQIKKIAHRKIPDIKAKGHLFSKVFIVNILADNSFQVNESINEEIVEVPYLIDKENFKIDPDMIIKIKNHLLK